MQAIDELMFVLHLNTAFDWGEGFLRQMLYKNMLALLRLMLMIPMEQNWL